MEIPTCREIDESVVETQAEPEEHIDIPPEQLFIRAQTKRSGVKSLGSHVGPLRIRSNESS